MTWTRLSDNFADRPDVLELSDGAFRAHVCALIWCNRQLTDGRIPARAATRAVSVEDPTAAIDELVEAGLWQRAEEGFQLDWSDQETAERVGERKRLTAQRQADYRDRQLRHARGDHSTCLPKMNCQKQSQGVTRDVTRNNGSDSPTLVTATRPVPTRPDPKGGSGSGEGTAANTAPGSPASPSPSRHAPVLNIPRKAREA